MTNQTVGPATSLKPGYVARKRKSRKRWFKWTVEFQVDHSWVADGFDLTNQRAKAMLAKSLLFAHNSELKARVVGRPPALRIRQAQGYAR